jgi:hypothetical protein
MFQGGHCGQDQQGLPPRKTRSKSWNFFFGRVDACETKTNSYDAMASGSVGNTEVACVAGEGSVPASLRALSEAPQYEKAAQLRYVGRFR